MDYVDVKKRVWATVKIIKNPEKPDNSMGLGLEFRMFIHVLDQFFAYPLGARAGTT
jgi:hypothetical protein